MEAENGVMQPRAKEYLEPPVEEAKDSPRGPSEGTCTCRHPDFLWPKELRQRWYIDHRKLSPISYEIPQNDAKGIKKDTIPKNRVSLRGEISLKTTFLIGKKEMGEW